MIRVFRDFRLLPLVLLATGSLLALKLSGLAFNGGFLFTPQRGHDARAVVIDAGASSIGPIATSGPVASADAADPEKRASWAQDMFNFPDVTGSIGDDKKGAAKKDAGSKPADKESGNKGADQKEGAPAARTIAKAAPNTPVSVLDQRVASPSERAILGRLQERRKELDDRSRELDMRETLIKAAEKRLEGKVKELKQVENRIKVANGTSDGANAERFKHLVTMYESMKPKDAARIFDRLDLKILVDVAGKINPRQMSEILANMSSEAAERLTVEFANRGGGLKGPAVAELPKIKGRPNPTP